MTLFTKLSVAAASTAFALLALIPTDTTPIPRPNFPPSGGDGGYYSEYPKVTFIFDKSITGDAKSAYKSTAKKLDWLNFEKIKAGGLFSDKAKVEQYKDRLPAYELLNANAVLVADITKTSLDSEEELVSVCENLRDKLESNNVYFRSYLGKQSFTPVGMSDNVIFQIHDDMLTLFSKAVTAGKDYTLVSISSHENKDSSSIFTQSSQAAKAADVSLIVVDSLDWRNMKILSSMEVKTATSCVQVLLGKDGKVRGRLDKTNPTLEELNSFIKTSTTSSSQL